MKHLYVEGKSLPQAYHKALLKLNAEGQLVGCPDYNTQCKECGMTFYIENALQEPMISRLFVGGHHELQQYVMEVCDGILDFMIGKGENVWEYTYHDRIKDQVDFVVKELHNNPNSRRAIIDVRDNSVDMFNDHPACLQNIMVMIRDNKLDMKVLMRSNDATEATFMNAFAFIQLQKLIATMLKVGIGNYTHTANSFHCYEKDFALLDHYCERLLDDNKPKTTYTYEGFYRQLMADEIPSIMEMVNEQKRKYEVK